MGSNATVSQRLGGGRDEVAWSPWSGSPSRWPAGVTGAPNTTSQTALHVSSSTEDQRMTSEERKRVDSFGHLEDGLFDAGPWYQWGPYLSERAWGTVREDYSAEGTRGTTSPTTTLDLAPTAGVRTAWPGSATSGRTCAWRSRCGTDVIRSSRSACSASPGPRAITARTSRSTGGSSTRCPATPGCTGATTTRRPSSRTAICVAENARRDQRQPEYELLDTGVFDDDRYWVVDVVHAKADPQDLLMEIRVTNAGPETDTLHVLPHLWFRNTWSWDVGAIPSGDACRRERSRRGRAPALR